ncbi:tetratricopeptide repeat domain-containing protein PYG7, chloroplastic isoform X1 [Punica granatum]|uniref:Tetratricopeptide repeat domain-containing protein PYG7, chloroplastic isoform X1 n=3 Tax=Punica granatum TaxID=22663 RepID=A0A218W4N7_PUNGR|nr:tetratricopeptide repeat domain-containing protein PYG7, chloroplastic isoform X1 [Punica granatum]OWM67479.1 hypothetical protein CDL15_Pgr028342 [Punica granatum]
MKIVVAQSSRPHPLQHHHLLSHLHSYFSFGFFSLKPPKLAFQHCSLPGFAAGTSRKLGLIVSPKSQICQREVEVERFVLPAPKRFSGSPLNVEHMNLKKPFLWFSSFSLGAPAWLICAQEADASEMIKVNAVYETGELFELGIQLSYLLLLLALLGVGSFFVIRQVLVRRELDLSAKELQEQVRSGDASATGLFELGAVMLRRKFYPAAIKYLLQAIDKWDGDDQDLAQVYNALGVTYIRDGKTEKGIQQFEMAVKLQPGYVTAWNNLGDAYEKKKDLNSALKAFEEVLLFDPNNKVARPRRDALKEKVTMYKGVPVKSKKR